MRIVRIALQLAVLASGLLNVLLGLPADRLREVNRVRASYGASIPSRRALVLFCAKIPLPR